MSKNVRTMVYMSFLIALSIILTRLMSFRIAVGSVEGVRIGLGGLPIIFAGIAFGPSAGGIVGAISDLIGYFINPMGGYMPHFTLSTFLTGFIPGFVMKYLFKHKTQLWMLLLAIALGELTTSVGLVPYFLQDLFGIPWTVSLAPRLVALPIQVSFYAVFIRTLLTYKPVNTLVQKAQ